MWKQSLASNFAEAAAAGDGRTPKIHRGFRTISTIALQRRNSGGGGRQPLEEQDRLRLRLTGVIAILRQLLPQIQHIANVREFLEAELIVESFRARIGRGHGEMHSR